MQERRILKVMLMGTVVLSLSFVAIFLLILIPEVRTEGGAFPRLGMWWLDPYKTPVEEMGRYHLLIDNFDSPELTEKLKDLRAQAPYQRVFKPIGPSERQLFITDPNSGTSIANPEIERLPSVFFLSQTGTQLSTSIDAKSTVVKVDQLVDGFGSPYFKTGASVMIGLYESAKVLAIDIPNKTLTLKRGYVRPASDHTAGTRIASHISFWPDTWVMNVTQSCPKMFVFGLKSKVTYSEYYMALTQEQVRISYPEGYYSIDSLLNVTQYDGLVLDRLEERQSFLMHQREEVIQLDLEHNNLSTQADAFDASWKQGVDLLILNLRRTVGPIPIIRNNPLLREKADEQGQIYETYGWSNPTQEWWHGLIVGSTSYKENSNLPYLAWDSDDTVLFEVYENERFPTSPHEIVELPEVPNYRRMRYGLTSALMGNGYFSYELSTNGHGALGLMWFDEYDLGIGRRGYLGNAKGQAVQVAPDVYLRKFSKGVAIVNGSESWQTVKLGAYYQHIKGTQDPQHNTGEIAQQVTLRPFDGVILLKLPLLYQWTYNAQQFEE